MQTSQDRAADLRKGVRPEEFGDPHAHPALHLPQLGEGDNGGGRVVAGARADVEADDVSLRLQLTVEATMSSSCKADL
jgi:hypothetical protein